MNILINIGSWIAKRLAALGVTTAWLAFLGPIAPVLAAIGQLIGGIVTAISEIIVSLSKSAEGRVVLGLALAALGFLYLRFHYIEEGKALGRVNVASIAKACPKPVKGSNDVRRR